MASPAQLAVCAKMRAIRQAKVMAEYAGLTKAQLWQKARLKFYRKGFTRGHRQGFAEGYERAVRDMDRGAA
jgi:flagellar biosynthesis/type III secretory pathway protein FliH